MALMIGIVGLWAAIALGTAGVDDRTLEFGKEYTGRKFLGTGEYLDLKYTFTQGENTTQVELAVCENKCEGGKHAKHSDCDASCDKPCNTQKVHHAYLAPVFTPLAPDGTPMAKDAYLRQMNRVLTQERLPHRAESVFGDIKGLTDRGNKFDKLKWIGMDVPCWNTEHCSASQGWVEAEVHSLTVQYQFASDPDWSGPEPEKKGGSGTLRFTVALPKPNLQAPSPPEPNCRCQPPTPAEPPKETGMIPGNFGDGEYAHVDQGGKKRVITGTELASVVKNVVCNDMNTAAITVAAMPDAKVVVPAGWELECIEGNGQNVQLQEDLEIPMSVQQQTLLVSLNPLSRRLDTTKTLRTLCLEIDAPEPRPGMKYRLVPPSSRVLSRLARITRRSSFKGPLDQVRLWIATDFASHAKIGKVLFPPPREAQYLREMWRAAGVGAINPFDLRIQSLMEEKLLLAEGGDPAAVLWCAEAKLKAGNKALIPWLAAQKDTVAKLFAEGPPEADVAIIGALCGALTADGTVESIRAAIALIRAVPEANKPLLYKSVDVLSVAEPLASMSNEAIATVVLEWLETDKPPFSMAIGANVNPALPDSIKSRAKALARGKKAA